MFLLSTFIVVALSSSNAFTKDMGTYCQRHEGSALHQTLILKLAHRLSYTEEEFCNHPRILDIFLEDRLVYNGSTDSYEDYKFITISYNEYSCQYSYNLETELWGKQYCYNTF